MTERIPALAGLLCALLLASVQVLDPAVWRVRALDLLQLVMGPLEAAAGGPEPAFAVTVVDIDRASLEAIGPWPWPRATMAKLVAAVAEAGPAAIGIDILFAEPDRRSPAALARQLAAAAPDPALAELAQRLPDGDLLLADAVESTATVLGFVLDPDGAADLPGPPFLVAGRPDLRGLWRSDGGTGPAPVLATAASGLGALSLPGDPDGRVRRVPLLVAAGPAVLPGLALETLRLASGSAGYRLLAPPDGPLRLEVGGRELPLPADGFLPLGPKALPEPRSLSARTVLSGKTEGMQGGIVLIGSSAPESGGLRATAFAPLSPSVGIHADAIEQLMRGRVLLDVPLARWLEPAAGLILAGLVILAALRLGPIAGLVMLTGLGLTWIGAAGAMLHWADRLLDPAGPVLVAAGAFAVTAVGALSLTRRRELHLRESFGRRLHPAVVERLARSPEQLKLAGEWREVTVLATDLEDFTVLTRRLAPTELIALLDRYLEGIGRIVVDHGAMIDKLVGDAVHAIFNAPLDLPDHPERALAAASAILAWTERFRAEPAAQAVGFGRTRIGLETGIVVVGDVGLGTRLDYTAYGEAMNLAVRLEGQNKLLGTAILIGPVAAAALGPSRLRPLGAHPVRGIERPLELFTPAEVGVPDQTAV
ncbi:CHASE2 domain-containing protein [Geminicoccus flavidas]|uniref:CHASE2 domain-containing protein n=1 Tax=Geminicoccus flavidas TaxID=2506407 RepID=UPI00135B7A2B|nr:adenylate/guanylate cyclase domain-containing protein [Geminicoccus flavidas]